MDDPAHAGTQNSVRQAKYATSSGRVARTRAVALRALALAGPARQTCHGLVLRVVQPLLASPRTPFGLRSRILWWKSQWHWIAWRPTSWSEKLNWKMLKDRRPLLTTFADKVAVREYVAGTVGSAYLTECYAVLTDPSHLDLASLPAEFVAKVNHGSGGVWIVRDNAPPGITVTGGDRDPVNPGASWCRVVTRREDLDPELLVRTLGQWLEKRYTDSFVEFAYLNIEPRILVEELVREVDGTPPYDYGFYVLNGRARIIHVNLGIPPNHLQRLYRPDWTPVDAQYAGSPRAETDFPRPHGLEQMVDVAETLGRETDFVRVDLYNVDGRIVFGELTNSPGAGTRYFTPRSLDLELGRDWKLPRRYR